MARSRKKETDPSKHTVQTITLEGKTTTHHILEAFLNGGCRNVSKCMEKVSITEAMWKKYGDLPHQSRAQVDAGHVRSNHKGYRWMGPTPRVMKNALIKFDQIITQGRRHKKSKEEIEQILIKEIPEHDWKVKLTRGTKILPRTEIKKNREPSPSHSSRYTLRNRIVGFR